MRAEYAALVQREQAENLTAEASAAILLDRLAQMGFDDYTQFMAHAEEQEVRARNHLLGRDQDGEARQISGIVDLWSTR